MATKMDVNGRKIPGTPIAVDFFQRSLLPARMLFFLTHAHADHLHGLDSSFDQKIYCTAMTKTLLLLIVSLDPELIVEVEYDEPFQVHLPCSQSLTICVTAIDACHCPGSAMFLFEGYFGTILHTGDFRLTPELLSHRMLKTCEPDLLYLDNTYNKPECLFPSREVTQEQIVHMVESSPDTRTFIALNRVGKEELLLAIARRTSLKIGVSEEQYTKLCALGLGEICSRDTDQCQVVVVPFYSVKPANVDRWLDEMPTQVIVPTARFVSRECSLPAHPSVRVVPHSDHCNYPELIQFVELVRPIDIQPIVHNRDCLNMSHFEHLLSKRSPTQFIIPNGIDLAPPISYVSKRFLGRPKPLLSSTSIRPARVRRGIEYISPKKTQPADFLEATQSNGDCELEAQTNSGSIRSRKRVINGTYNASESRKKITAIKLSSSNQDNGCERTTVDESVQRKELTQHGISEREAGSTTDEMTNSDSTKTNLDMISETKDVRETKALHSEQNYRYKNPNCKKNSNTESDTKKREVQHHGPANETKSPVSDDYPLHIDTSGMDQEEREFVNTIFDLTKILANDLKARRKR